MVYGILQCSNTDGDFFLVTRLLRIVERVQDIGSSLFCHLLPASLPCAQTRVHCSALHCTALKAIRSPCMFFLWVRQHIHILDRQLKASQSLSAREKLKKMTHLPKASHRHKLCVTRQIYSHLLLDPSSAPDLRGTAV